MAQPENIVFIIPDSKASADFAEQVAEKVFCRMLDHFEQNSKRNDGEKWLRIVDAKKILPFSSKKKWKSLRDDGEIEFSKPAREFLYLESSLKAYLKRNSTISNQKSK